MSLADKRHYTGQIYYIRKGYNRWQMKFIVVRDIDAFMKVWVILTCMIPFIHNCSMCLLLMLRKMR